MSDEESYECYGEGDTETLSPVNNVLSKYDITSQWNAIGLH